MSAKTIEVLNLIASPERGQLRAYSKLEIDDKGVIGDYHHGLDHQVVMLPKSVAQAMLHEIDNALCMGRFYAHILTKDYTPDELRNHSFISHGPLKLEVVKDRKACHQAHGCDYAKTHQHCPLILNTRFLSVVSGGTIAINDRLEVE